MSVKVNYPTNAEIDQTVQDYVPMVDKFIGSEFMPIVPRNVNKVKWEEKDNMRGMTAAHRRGNEPKVNKREGTIEREFEPLDFKETDVVGEKEILEKRQEGTWGEPLDLTDTVTDTIKERADKTMIRVEWTRWQFFKGLLEYEQNGVKVKETSGIQTHNILVPWDDYDDASPLQNFDEIGDKFTGTGASNDGAVHVMTRPTFRDILRNNNEADLKKFAGSNFVDVMNGLTAFNRLLQDRNGSMIRIYEEGYHDDDNDFLKFLALGDVVTFGKRPMGQKHGEWQATISLHRQENGKPIGGYFSILEVNGQASEGETTISLAQLGRGKNPKFEVTGGIYGGPSSKYPKSVVYTRTRASSGATMGKTTAKAEENNTGAAGSEDPSQSGDAQKSSEKSAAAAKRVEVICGGTLGHLLLEKGDVTEDADYVALLKTARGKKLVREVK